MKEDVKRIMAKVFKIDKGSIPDDIAYGDHEIWDSMHHLNLIVEFESYFGVLFEPEEIQSMTNIDNIVSCILQKKVQ
jgi:acyl carrier protein